VNKHYISPQQLLEDAFNLAWQVFDSGFRPNVVVGVWRGGAPVGIAVHELLHVLGVEADHTAVRSSSYTGIGQRNRRVQVDGLDYLTSRLAEGDRLLLVDDVHDTGLSLQQIRVDLGQATGLADLDIRIATPYFKPGNNQTGNSPDYHLHRTEAWLVFPHELDGLSLAEMRAHKPELAPLLERLASRLET
jgi:hypoxanthine phosphoribosyltransferase